MDKNSIFSPTKDEAKKIADDYWADLTDYREKTFNYLHDLIKANAQSGNYKITSEILKSEKDYIKEKLEDSGYKTKLLDQHQDQKYMYIEVSFE